MPFGKDRPDPRPFLRSIWRRRWLLAAMILGIPLAVYILSSLLPEQYAATTTLQARSSGAEPTLASAGASFPPPSAQEAARLVETTAVATKAAEELGESSTEASRLLEDVTAISESEAAFGSVQLFSITAQAGSAERAADVANAFATSVTTYLIEQAVNGIDDTIKALRSGAETDSPAAERSLDRQILELETLRASRPSSLQIIDRAAAPQVPASPKPLRNTALALVLSVLLAGALVPLLDRLDRNIHEPDELEELTGSRLLAAIPKRTFGNTSASGLAREAYQTLRTSLMYFNVDRPITSLLIASPGPGEGKTTVATSLASAMARSHMDVILVDADLRRRPIAAWMGTSGRHGLGSVLLGQATPADALESIAVDGGRVRVLSGGEPVLDPSVLLGSQRMHALMEEFEAESDIVIVDTPPILAVSDAIPLFARVSGVLLVGRLEQTTREAFWRADRVIRSAQGRVLGVVATDVPSELRDTYGAQYAPSEPEAAGGHARSSSSV